MKTQNTQAGGGLSHRIEVYLVTQGQAPRELVEIGDNEHGDIVLTFAEGDRIQFTPQMNRYTGLAVPTVENVKGVYQNRVPRLSSIRVKGDVIFGDLRTIPRPDHPAIIAAVREEGEATRQTVGEFWQGLLEKFGLVRKRARWPRVSSNAKNRAAAMWKAWPETRLDAQAGGEKVDCFEYHSKELKAAGIASLEHFKAVLDKARK